MDTGIYDVETLFDTDFPMTKAERLEYGFHELYLHNGIRITIYSGHRTKENQEIMVFRKYVLENYTFGELAEKGTIPEAAIPLFLAMIEAGFNIMFSGQVRSGKTTFLRVWQSHEDPELEGLGSFKRRQRLCDSGGDERRRRIQPGSRHNVDGNHEE